MNNRPIGMFDSGIGGLTVLRAVIDRLPNEHIIYLGDDARGPYGPLDIKVVRDYSHEIIRYLIEFGVKLIIVACNSATAAVLAEAQTEYDIPIVGVIMPGARAAVRKSTHHRIGVIGTKCTIDSGLYELALKGIDPGVEVLGQACPELVDFVERGEVYGNEITEVALGYLDPLCDNGIDTLIMGCTHYPLLQGLLQAVVGPDVELISSAEETALEVEDILDKLGWIRASTGSTGVYHFLTTGDVMKAVQLGQLFLGPEVSNAVHVNFDYHPELLFEETGEQ